MLMPPFYFISLIIACIFCRVSASASPNNQILSYPDILIDSEPSETFLQVFLRIYHIQWNGSDQMGRIISVLSDFESNPARFYEDEFCLNIVMSEILKGFSVDFPVFFYNRSRRLLLRIFLNKPRRIFWRNLLILAEDNDAPDLIDIIKLFLALNLELEFRIYLRRLPPCFNKTREIE